MQGTVFGALIPIWIGGGISETYDFAVCGLAAHLLGLELPKSRYVLHDDADMSFPNQTDLTRRSPVSKR